jgi:site-specific recombinase XerD
LTLIRRVIAISIVVSHTSLSAVRNRALIALLYRSGLRISEALALYPKDIDFASGAIRVLHGKGDKSRTVGIDAGATDYVQHWLAVRQRWGVTGCLPIFCTRSGQQLGEGYIGRLFPSLGRIAGIQKRVHPHGLRHTHAAQLREEGIDVGIISKQLGHGRDIWITLRQRHCFRFLESDTGCNPQM